MSHVRAQIRSRLRAALVATLPVTYDVFASRKYARNLDPARPLVDMRFSNDQTRARETMGDDRVHVASLYVRVQLSAADETLLDDALDADEIRIVTAMESVSWLDLLEEDPELMQVNFSEDAQNGRAIGAIVIRYDMEYRIEKDDPSTAIP